MSYEGLRFNWDPKYATGEIQNLVIDVVETHLVETPLTDKEISLMSFYDELGRQAAKEQGEK